MTQEARYYYDCPIKAAFMSKYHGMKFKSARGQTLYYDGGSDFRAEKDGGFYAGEKYFVSPESLPLLQPQVGDLVHIGRGFCSYYKEVVAVARSNKKDVTGIWCEGVHWDTTSKEPLHDWEILKRNGTPFIMPERD